VRRLQPLRQPTSLCLGCRCACTRWPDFVAVGFLQRVDEGRGVSIDPRPVAEVHRPVRRSCRGSGVRQAESFSSLSLMDRRRRVFFERVDVGLQVPGLPIPEHEPHGRRFANRKSPWDRRRLSGRRRLPGELDPCEENACHVGSREVGLDCHLEISLFETVRGSSHRQGQAQAHNRFGFPKGLPLSYGRSMGLRSRKNGAASCQSIKDGEIGHGRGSSTRKTKKAGCLPPSVRPLTG